MTTKELLEKAYKITSKHLDVTSIDFKISKDNNDQSERMSLMVFYSFRDKDTNFSASSYSSRENYGINNLLFELKAQIKEEKQRLFPKEVITDLSISEPEKTASNETN